MKKIFLTSIGLEALVPFIDKDPTTVTVGFIATAADNYVDKGFVDRDRTFFLNRGFKLQEIDIKDRDQVKKISHVDVIYVAGGNTFYLLEKARESGADEFVKTLVEEGMIYAGGSAGAVLAGPNIEPVSLLDDPQQAPSLTSYEGLNLVEFVVLPHYGKEKYISRQELILNTYRNSNLKILPVTDQQAVVVNGNEYQVIDATVGN